jgi:sec-independent protein translocase protein TatC
MSENPEEKLAEGTLISHLLELRDRLIRCCIAVAIVFVPCMSFANDLFTYVAKPLMDKLPHGNTLIATTVMSPFLTPFKTAFFIAVLIAMPYVLYQLWAFVAPGLYRHEKRFAIPLLASSIILFYAGITFAYFVVFPVMFAFFASTTPPGVSMMPDIGSYLDFLVKMFFAFGVAFEVPIAVVLLVSTGIVRIEKLKSNRGYVLIGTFVIAALITPPDVVSQSVMAVPMYALYEAGIVMAGIMSRGKGKAAEAKGDDGKQGA